MKTTVEINGTVYEVVPQKFTADDWEASCWKCDCHFIDENGLSCCRVVNEFDCMSFDTDTFGVHLKRLAKPSIGLNTPSEARRRALV